MNQGWVDLSVNVTVLAHDPTWQVTVVGREPDAPYNRVLLSQALAGGAPVPDAVLDSGAPAGAEPGDHLVCSCQVVSSGEIRSAIAEHGLETVEAVSERTGAATGCGGCRPDVEALLRA